MCWMGSKKDKDGKKQDSVCMTRYTFLNTNQIFRFITSLGGKQYAKNETIHTKVRQKGVSQIKQDWQRRFALGTLRIWTKETANHHSFLLSLISFFHSSENIKCPILLDISICKWKTIFEFWSLSWKCGNIGPESLLMFPTNLFRIRLNF